MFRKVSYGTRPKFTANDRKLFSRGNYDCHFLLQNWKGEPVTVSQNNDPDFPIWKVEYGYSCVVFGSYDEAMAYCKGRFCTLSGKPLSEKEA